MTASVEVLSGEQAVRVAGSLGEAFAEGAAQRDRDRLLPHDQVDELAASGLLAITVPAAFGGADLPVEVVAEVFRLLSKGDPNLGQIPVSHFVYVNQLRLQGTLDQQERFFAEVLAGRKFGNAQSERGTEHARDYRTTLTRNGDAWRLDGTKFYCTGAMFADWIPVLAHAGPDGPLHVAWVGRHDDGVEVVDDWDALGQRTTASGTVRLDGVVVTDDQVTSYSDTFDGPTTFGSFAQVLHASIDAGIARAALEDAAAFVTTKSRPHPDADVRRAADDPLVVQTFGMLELQVRAAEALLAEAARAVDRADADLDAASAGHASLAVAAARASTSHAAVDTSSRLFEVAGTRSAASKESLDRHWRNARTHTLHDPAAWKVQHLGRWAVDSTLPPRHGQL
ncbi:SfnB family sulfur acquisition oxidoreductase [Aeromicrobium endophyticum]|uniref:SfnB family sulfur acquisition oxidoreductase n=1 Tax=Aeromicrobium endophyticum TaxID=2292704 RepID=A0A371P4T8_9ACTN|nr:SfnB family sulfur acquisition oxidoreductase [Aeromicrobium endophyticum]REK70967.1 SfnB family sulfur acquisition oxidoreductase [Aeromicrobium endophyticum]